MLREIKIGTLMRELLLSREEVIVKVTTLEEAGVSFDTAYDFLMRRSSTGNVLAGWRG